MNWCLASLRKAMQNAADTKWLDLSVQLFEHVRESVQTCYSFSIFVILTTHDCQSEI